MEKKRNGKIIFISGPSGVGKGTLISALRERHPEWAFPPSCTTRVARPGEKDGETYFFLTEREFLDKVRAGEFLETAKVHDEYFYGTLRQKLLEPFERGQVVVREFDVQGFLTARDRLPRAFYAAIFLVPAEGVENLIHRIRSRAPISDSELEHRIRSAKKEIEMASKYDFQIKVFENQIEKMIGETEEIIEKFL